MLRRRRKSTRDTKGKSPYSRRPQGAHHRESSKEPQPSLAKSRRRGRPDAPVPAELIVKADTLSPTPAQGNRERNRRPTLSPALPQGGGRNSAEVVLVTGFDPFGGEKTNPSWDVCTRLPREIAGLRVETCRIPCEFRRSIEVVAEAIERHRPALVVCIGQAGGRAHLSVERVAINVDDARLADNSGARPVDEPIAPNGPPAYFATLPVKAMAAAIRATGVPAEISDSAGTYVCNHLMYGVLHYLAASGHKARAGFIHVPFSEEQVLDKPDAPAMAIDSMVKGIQAAITAAREHRHDLKIAGGALA
jgi:pyroglutamyl-peptidase